MAGFKKYTKYLIFATAITPLIFVNSFPFPHTFSKIFFFRIVVEILLILFLAYIFWTKDFEVWRRLKSFFRNPLAIGVFIFFLSLLISTIFAQNQFHAFWGDAARGDGFLNLVHFLIFLLISYSVFSKEDWLSFFKISIFIGGVVVLFDWIHYLSVRGIIGFDNLWFGIGTALGSGGSSLGNPAFLGAYLIFLAGFCLLVFYKSRGFWQYFSGILFLVSLLSILITTVRGTLLGLAVAVIFSLVYLSFRKLNPDAGQGQENNFGNLRKISRIVLTIILVTIVLFGVTKNSAIWQSVPGFNRLASLSFSDPSFRTRQIALGVSLDASREHPVFGWGLENYITAYNKHYNPEYAVYEEAFFDRAHNKLAEILVIQGLFGLLSYLGLFVLLFYFLFRKKIDVWIRVSLGSILSAYFIQNLFLFDTPVSYLMLFSLIGFILAATDNSNFENREFNYSRIPILGGKIATFVMALIVIYSLFNFNYVPFVQSRIYRAAEQATDTAKLIEDAPQFLEPYNFIQPTIRFQFLQSISQDPSLRSVEFGSVVEVAANAMTEVVNREPNYDLRNHTLLGEVYNERGKVDLEVLILGEKYLREALDLGPKRQDTYYLLAFNMAAQGRFDESVAVNKKAIALDPEVAKSHYNLGISYVLAGRKYYDLAEESLDKALEIGFLDPSNLRTDFQNISIAYEGMISAYIMERDRESTIRLANKIRDLNNGLNGGPVLVPELASDMDVIIDYVIRGEWDALIKAISG